MTDKEIIKALETCILGDCQGCFYGDTNQRGCTDDLMKNALDLINRQQAEIERLQKSVDIHKGIAEDWKYEARRLKEMVGDDK